MTLWYSLSFANFVETFYKSKRIIKIRVFIIKVTSYENNKKTNKKNTVRELFTRK